MSRVPILIFNPAWAMNKEKLKNHIKLCKRNLRSKRVKCCAECPFEEEIVGEYPEFKKEFIEKRRYVSDHS